MLALRRRVATAMGQPSWSSRPVRWMNTSSSVAGRTSMASGGTRPPSPTSAAAGSSVNTRSRSPWRSTRRTGVRPRAGSSAAAGQRTSTTRPPAGRRVRAPGAPPPTMPPPHGGPAQTEVAGVDEQVLEHGEVLVEVVLLGDDPDPRAHLPGLAVGVQLQHVKLAGGPPQPAEEHLHGGGLAGAVGAQEAEALAVL